MIDNFLTVSMQVFILFILIGIGFLCQKGRLFCDEAAKGMTDLVLYVVTPCIIINSFCREFDRKMLKGLLLTFVIAVCVHLFSIIIAHLLLRDKIKDRECILRFSLVFSNCGFMAFPLQQAILGDDGVFYGAVFVAVFNLCLWSYGVFLMGKGKEKLSAKKLLINPGIIGIVVGLIIFVGSVRLPEVISKPLGYISSLNTPLPMIIIGYHLAKSNLSAALKDKKIYLLALLRLIAVPACVLAVLTLLKIESTVLTSCIICASAPVAATTTMFSLKFNRDTQLSVNAVSATTVFSIVTMPAIVALAQYLV